LENTKISIFGGISKFHLWADFGNFGQLLADFAALIVADSMPQLMSGYFSKVTLTPKGQRQIKWLFALLGKVL
jgi:hypothetical protein